MEKLTVWVRRLDNSQIRIHVTAFDLKLFVYNDMILGCVFKILRSVSISDKTSYRKISWSIEAVYLVVEIIASLCNLTGTSAALLLKCLSNFRAIGQFWIKISRLRVFKSSYNTTSYWKLKRGPGLVMVYLTIASFMPIPYVIGNVKLAKCCYNRQIKWLWCGVGYLFRIMSIHNQSCKIMFKDM